MLCKDFSWLIFIAVIVLIGCSSMPQPPQDIEMCSIDLTQHVCYRYKKDATGNWQYIGDKPEDQWDKGFIVTPEHMIEIKQYAKDLAAWISKNVK